MMIYCTKIHLLILWSCSALLIIISVKGNILFENTDGKLIIVDSVVSWDNVSRMMYDEDYRFSGAMNYNISSSKTKHLNDGCICVDIKKCFCTTLQGALNNVEDNTIIAINTTLGEFTANVALFNYANILITGYYKVITINCLSRGSIEFQSCRNIIIKNITWISCGYNQDDRGHFGVPGPNNEFSVRYIHNFDNFFDIYFSGLRFGFCTNISLLSCSFEASMVRVYEASGIIHINRVNFLSTSDHDVHDHISLATGLIISQITPRLENLIKIQVINSLFSQTESLNASNNLLLFYVFINNTGSIVQVLVNQTNFSSVSYDPGWAAENGMIWLRILSCRDGSIEFNGVKFLSNYFQPDRLSYPFNRLYRFEGLLSIISDSFQQSRPSITIKIDSCTFLNNDANRIMSFQGDIFLHVINTKFYNNKADSMLFVAYAFKSPDITTTLNLEQSVFSSNTGGQFVLLTGEHLLVNISALQITNNTLLSKNDGLFLFKDYDTLIVIINNINYEFNGIKKSGSGFRFTSASTRFSSLPGAFFNAFCIPSNFLFNIPEQYVVTEYVNANSDNCFNSIFQWFLITNSSFNNNIGGGHGAIIYFNYNVEGSTISTISTCTFNNNSGHRSLIYASSRRFVGVYLIVKDNSFLQNAGTVFYITNQSLQFSNDMKVTVFDSNMAQNGAAVYINLNSQVTFTNNSAVSFSNNIARRYGGAFYFDISQSSNACYQNASVFRINSNGSIISNNNQARAAGNSIYFSIPQSCNSTVQYDTVYPVFNQSAGEVVMSPHSLILYNPAQLVDNVDHSTVSTYYVSGIMLGQNIIIPACVLDYNGMPLWSIQFTVQLDENTNQNYSFQGNQIITVDCRTLQGINNMFITGNPLLNGINSTLTIQLNSFYDSVFDWRPIKVNLNVQLSTCHLGYHYDSDLKYCVCYTTDDIVTCSDSNSTIRNGYWFGTINEQPTFTVCPVNYCNFDNCVANTGSCDLHPIRDNQCRAHRSGIACGNCEEGYTLSFDSPDCISIDKCTIGQTVLVVTMSLLYWMAVIVVVFCMMYFRIEIGYLYGITFYYSIIDILLLEGLQFHETLFQFATILSGIAKLLPQFLGPLCFVKGLSGIDQQFIHYLHPLAVLLLLLVISIIARFSPRLSSFVGRAVIHAICLLLLLSYTSIASTSLLLIRAIRFVNVDELYTYLSPDIEYFHGRHLIYGLVAILIGLVIVIGLPLLLSLEPFVNRKINFIRIKPWLDQFQGCYKDNFRYFASYYMIFRVALLSILVINASNVFVTLYALQVLCTLLMFIHILIKPYSNNLLNLFDSFMLSTMMLVISLLIIDTYRGFQSNATFALALILIILPLFGFIAMTIYLHIKDVKKFVNRCIEGIKNLTDGDHDSNAQTNQNIEMHSSDCDVIADQQLRDRSTTIM